MKNNKRLNLICLTVSIILYIVYVVCLFMFQPFVASAAEKVPGGVGNHVTYRGTIYYLTNDRKRIVSGDYFAGEDVEIVGRLGPNGDSLFLYAVKDNNYYSLKASYLMDLVYAEVMYEKDDSIISSKYESMTIGSITTNLYYGNYTDDLQTRNISITGLKIFGYDISYLEAYAKNGSLDGMLTPEDDVDSGELDHDIGYLHNLQHKSLLYGEQDENGIYSSYDDRFTWSNYYPEYDESYLVEVRSSCEVEVRKWFGIGKSTVYNSNIRKLADNVPYKDLEYIVGLDEQKALFSDFINEHMPGNDSVSDVISSATYQFDAYYFRIYRWDEETQTYKYGLWVRLTKDGSALDATLNTTVDAGELDDDGNWKQKTDSDYGKGKKDTTIVGSGGNQETAKSETDRKQEEKDNGGKQIDLSNTNFQELWEWFCGVLETFWKGLGVIPDFFGRLFSFFPPQIILLIGGSIVVAVVLRILGR